MSDQPKVLVTGGAGYIGSHVVLALSAAGYAPIVLDNLTTGAREAVPGNVVFHQADVEDEARVREVIARSGTRSVLHFAGSISVDESMRDPEKYYRNNTAASTSFIRSCLAEGVERFIFSSTAAVYGAPEAVPIREDAALQPISPYGASKMMTEAVLRDVAAAEPQFRPLSLRYFNVAGADPQGRAGQRGPQTTHLVRAAIEAALGQRPFLEIYGTDYETADGTCERDYVHVADLAEAHVAALAYLEAGGAPVALNCGYGQGRSVLEVVRGLEALLGRPVPTRPAPRRPGDPPRLVADSAELRRLLDWRPRHADLSAIIGSALDWQRRLAPAG